MPPSDVPRSTRWPLYHSVSDFVRNEIRKQAIREIQKFLDDPAVSNAIDRYLTEYPNHDSLFKALYH